MKAIKFLGNKKLKIIDIPKPEPKEGEAILKVMACGICRTDIELLYYKSEPTDIIAGHEVAGIVDEVNGTKKIKKGDRVLLNCHLTCGKCKHCQNGDLIFCPELKTLGFDFNGGYAEYVVAPENILRILPEDISYECGILVADALGTAYHGAKRAGIKNENLVGITGMGPVGLMAVVSVKKLGGKVFALDMISERLDAAKKLGADIVLNPGIININNQIKKATGGDGLDVVIDCTGSSVAINKALELVRVRGKFILIGVCTELIVNAYELITSREIEVIGSRNFNDNELEELFTLVREKSFIQDIVTHRFSISNANEAFHVTDKREGVKVILTP